MKVNIIKFNHFLVTNKPYFVMMVKDLTIDCINSYKEVILLSGSNAEADISNLNQVDDLIFEFINNKDSISYQIGEGLGMGDFFDDRIRVVLKHYDAAIDLSVPPIHKLEEGATKVMKVLNKYLNNFWQNNNYEMAYKNISKFDFYLDFDIQQSEYKKWFVKPFVINRKGWLAYVEDLTRLVFNDFSYIEKGRGSVFLFKPLMKDIRIVIYYIQDNIKHSYLPMPYRLIAVTPEFSAKKKLKDQTDEYFDLGILGNPFFYEPCTSVLSYVTLIKAWTGQKVVMNYSKYKRTFIPKNDALFVSHPQDYGEEIKKYAFFYLHLLKYTSTSYVAYLEKCLLTSLE